jgi:hypothetical protein
MVDNFNFFAMRYLNDWCADDRRFVTGLASPDRVTQLGSLGEAATYYGVARTLKYCDEKDRFGCALDALNATPPPRSDGAAVAAVRNLAGELQAKYGKNVISAASKFLWLRYRWPIVIYDSRAVACLRSCGQKFYPYDYADYRNAWQSEFTKRASAVEAACNELARVRDFSLANSIDHKTFVDWSSSQWFHERVFDKFLWWNAGG